MDPLPTTLLYLLSNTLVLRQTGPYLPISALLSLSGTNRSFRELILSHPETWRHLDLSRVKSAIVDSSPIDVGAVSWRAERMDESLTEDDFYAGPLRGIFSRLQARSVLGNVQCLVLDGLSVPADLVNQIISEARFNVRVLSLREARNLNLTKLQQALRYAVRPGRAESSLKLKALYVFGSKDEPRTLPPASRATTQAHVGGVMASEGAQIGAHWNSRSAATLDSSLPDDDQEKWYGSHGRIIKKPPHSDWAETLHACRGLIAFDAVLCRGPRHDITKVAAHQYLPPTIASVALGPSGCDTCHTCTETPAVFGQCEEAALPLLAPPASHASTVRAAQRPETMDGTFPKLIMRCEDCLRGRWCERCNRWWCESCYEEPISRTHGQVESEGSVAGNTGTVKVGVHRDCFGCGRTCEECKALFIRRCRTCGSEYCLVDNEGSSEVECDWCSHSGRRTRELY